MELPNDVMGAGSALGPYALIVAIGAYLKNKLDKTEKYSQDTIKEIVDTYKAEAKEHRDLNAVLQREFREHNENQQKIFRDYLEEKDKRSADTIKHLTTIHENTVKRHEGRMFETLMTTKAIQESAKYPEALMRRLYSNIEDLDTEKEIPEKDY